MAVESLIIAAWTAGVVEGSSILRKAWKEENAASPLMGLMLPSVVYATFALPLSVIAAAPGSRLVSYFPLSPSIEALESSAALDWTAVAPILVSHQQQQEPVKIVTVRKAASGDKRTEMIQKSREENKRALEVARQHQHHHHVTPSATASKKTGQGLMVATLDGRPLATPLAESMRRARFLLVGAGLILSIISYQQSKGNENYKGQERGRDVKALESLLRKGHDKVVVRLFHENHIPHASAASRTTIIPVSNQSAVLGEGVYWNLGQQLGDWKQTPMTRDWLLSPNQPILVLEADVSPISMTDYFEMLHSTTDTMDPLLTKTHFLSEALRTVATDKGVLAATDDEVVTVLVGVGQQFYKEVPWNSSSTVHIDSRNALGVEVAAVLEQMHAESSVEEHESKEQEDDDSDQEPPSPTFLRRIMNGIDTVGTGIRFGVEVPVILTASLARRVFVPSPKVVHLLSDQRNISLWLQHSLQGSWRIMWYNARNESDVKQFEDATLQQEGGCLSIICCTNDNATSAYLMAMLRSSAQSETTCRLLALVSREESESSIQSLAANSGTMEVASLSIEGVNASLFSNARSLLSEGKTPEEVQELMELIQ